MIQRLSRLLGAKTLAAAGLAATAAAAGTVSYTVVDGDGIPEALSAAPPNPDRGGVIYLDPDRGDCGACHSLEGMHDAPRDRKLAGPPLDGVASRLSRAELRLMIVNPRLADPEARMPAFFNISAEIAARAPDAKQPVLSGREIEDVIAFLEASAK